MLSIAADLSDRCRRIRRQERRVYIISTRRHDSPLGFLPGRQSSTKTLKPLVELKAAEPEAGGGAVEDVWTETWGLCGLRPLALASLWPFRTLNVILSNLMCLQANIFLMN